LAALLTAALPGLLALLVGLRVVLLTALAGLLSLLVVRVVLLAALVLLIHCFFLE
jgi:hypothetical protein